MIACRCGIGEKVVRKDLEIIGTVSCATELTVLGTRDDPNSTQIDLFVIPQRLLENEFFEDVLGDSGEQSSDHVLGYRDDRDGHGTQEAFRPAYSWHVASSGMHDAYASVVALIAVKASHPAVSKHVARSNGPPKLAD
jgi:hypothetical protein